MEGKEPDRRRWRQHKDRCFCGREWRDWYLFWRESLAIREAFDPWQWQDWRNLTKFGDNVEELIEKERKCLYSPPQLFNTFSPTIARKFKRTKPETFYFTFSTILLTFICQMLNRISWSQIVLAFIFCTCKRMCGLINLVYNEYYLILWLNFIFSFFMKNKPFDYFLILN